MGRRDLLLQKTKKIDEAQQIDINESETLIDNIINKLDTPVEEKIPEIIKVENNKKTPVLEIVEDKKDTVIFNNQENADQNKNNNIDKKTTKKSIKLKAPKKELKTVRTGFIITEKAKANLMRVTKEAGYRSTNDFINDLLENIDEYLA